MALKLEKYGENWNIIYSEHPSGEKVLWDVTGTGSSFVVPADVVEIRKRAFDRNNCPSLEQVFIPERVKVIHRDAFDGFDNSLEIRCACQYKPEGYYDCLLYTSHPAHPGRPHGGDRDGRGAVHE